MAVSSASVGSLFRICKFLAKTALKGAAIGFFLLVVVPYVMLLLSSPAISGDEFIDFYRTDGYILGKDSIALDLHGCVFEKEHDSYLRKIIIDYISTLFNKNDMTLEAAELYQKRAWLFVRDFERGKLLTVKITSCKANGPDSNGGLEGCEAIMRSSPNSIFKFDKVTDGTGHARTTINISHSDLGNVISNAKNGVLVQYAAVLGETDERVFTGEIQLVGRKGISVISDIDDTIKITEVLKFPRMMANTFLKPFQHVEGLPEIYKSWEALDGASFHYVSGSPYQLYNVLKEFMDDAGYPGGSMYLKTARVELLEPLEYDFIKLFAGVQAFKLAHILPLIHKYPDRDFILIGDSGEKDPEVYGKVFHQFPDQIKCIYIREVEDSDLSKERFLKAFDGVPDAQWLTFSTPSQLNKSVFSGQSYKCK
eukprot:Nk52_evm81s221 gene=Nk52_evmTU81s221